MEGLFPFSESQATIHLEAAFLETLKVMGWFRFMKVYEGLEGLDLEGRFNDCLYGMFMIVYEGFEGL